MNIKGIAKIAAAALVCAPAFAATVWAVSAPPDVAGRPYEEAVSVLAERDIITGDVDGLFYPDSNLTRAQFCTIVVKAMRAPAAAVGGTPTQDVKKSDFKDLAGYGWAEGYISYAVDKGVVTGYPDGTFRPGSNVTVNELITMTLRAAGYSDAALGGLWPENYVAKAGDIGALAGLTAPLPEYATKWIAAQLVYNVLSRIEEANPPEAEPPAGDTSPAETPPASALAFVAAGAFDSDITTFAGKAFASDMKLLRYGLKADYNKDMTLSENSNDYLEDSVYKYKNVETPAWYELDGDKIKRIILPKDVGFTGRAYGVIKNIVSVTDSQGGAVDGFVTLVAGRTVTWAGDSGLTKDNVPQKSDYDGGQLFEFQLRNGQVTNVASADFYRTFHAPLRASSVPGEVGSAGAFATVTAKTGNVVTVDLGDGGTTVFEIKEKAAVYLLDADGSYSVGSVSGVREKVSVRLYDVSDDTDAAADVVIIRE
ncbi:MAG: S-layer homology domain-containing protein [Clostridiales Family XIII bacterium]|nr:S-layer homology domain-containing protein [Clostridiales Family XIII bacterium]